MSLHLHHLAGCTPEPIAGYLKALGVLRAVASQADRGARARWNSGRFEIVTSLDRDGLARFFLEAYAPSPIIAPWNGGSGFYPKDTKEGVEPLSSSPADRFAAYREAIAAGRAIVAARAESPKGEDKLEMIRACRRAWPEAMLAWLDAAVVLAGDAARYPALLGTGGNDGRLDFTNNRMQRLVELFDPATGAARPGARPLLAAALFGEPAPGLERRAVGQFLPGNAGGPNQTSGYMGESLVNPWDFVLLLEGALLLPVAAVRRLESAGLVQAAAPFAVRARAGGYASACAADEGNQRGEQWMPLWGGAATLAEVRALFAEGRLVASANKRQADHAIDAARAVSSLGVARGVSEFVRFGYIERNGQANLAVPLGRWAVESGDRAGASSRSRLLDEIDPWVEGLRSLGQGDSAPAALGRALRRVEAAMLAVCRDGSPERWQQLLLGLAEAEAALISRPKVAAAAPWLGPLPLLSPAWWSAADDGSAELRLAAAIASQTGPAERAGADEIGPIRAHCLPLDPRSGFRRLAFGADGLVRDPRVVWAGRDLADDLAAVALRRMIEAPLHGARSFPLRGRAYAALDDIALFLDGAVDEARVAGLSRALMAVDWRRAPRPSRAPRAERPSALHALFRLAYTPDAVKPLPASGRDRAAGDLSPLAPRLDPAPLRLLVAGRLHDAGAAAVRTLTAAGARPKLRLVAGSADLARRLAATLAIPVAPEDLAKLLGLICKPAGPAVKDAPSTPPTAAPALSE
ncbi:type I-G CRISPR-associated protein Cas8g1/Csx17 [Sorangium sp. So ce1099]|uniref:type I-G CRISPR-associated protein Cas8g1/Csx17 n=1 Tax=Sorangium sp. So ce1099 TaxID=3133331 RepID=UPI003F62F798